MLMSLAGRPYGFPTPERFESLFLYLEDAISCQSCVPGSDRHYCRKTGPYPSSTHIHTPPPRFPIQALVFLSGLQPFLESNISRIPNQILHSIYTALQVGYKLNHCQLVITPLHLLEVLCGIIIHYAFAGGVSVRLLISLWRCGLVVDTWPRDHEVPGSSPGCARSTLSPWEGSLHAFPHPTHV